MPHSNGADGADDHYQPWLRGQDAPPVTRPAPLPTQGQARETPAPQPNPQARAAGGLSADELLARPIPMPDPSAAPDPSLGAKLGDAAAQARGWASDMVERADIPARVERLEIGRRARSIGDKAAELAVRGAAATRAAMRAAAGSTAHAAKRLGDAAGPRLRAAGEQVGQNVSSGAAKAGAAIADGARAAGAKARQLAEASPAAALMPANSAPPASQLDALIEAEAEAATSEQAVAGASLPLFVATQPQVSPTASPAAPLAPAPESAPKVMPESAPTAAPHAPPAPPAASITARSGGSPARDWLRHPASWTVGGLALLMGGFAGGMAWSGGISERAGTERIVHDYVLNHPEIIPQAMERLQATRTAEVIGRNRTAIERPFSGAWAGAAGGDVTLVVFTDYACTFCRASEADIARLLREDRRLKIVFRELPILSPESEPAARLALTAGRSGRYMDVHRALFASGNPDAAARSAVASRYVVDTAPATLANPAITAELRANVALARELGFDGTPSWVIGDKVMTGAIGYDALKAAIADARSQS
ncbi:MAG: thioredoxin domain-containing protein [Sphingopyxis sp.]